MSWTILLASDKLYTYQCSKLGTTTDMTKVSILEWFNPNFNQVIVTCDLWANSIYKFLCEIFSYMDWITELIQLSTYTLLFLRLTHKESISHKSSSLVNAHQLKKKRNNRFQVIGQIFQWLCWSMFDYAKMNILLYKLIWFYYQNQTLKNGRIIQWESMYNLICIHA